MSKDKTKTLKGIIKELKGKEGKEDRDIQIRTKDGNEQKLTFEKFEKDQETDEIEFQYRVKTKDGKWNDSDWKTFKSKVKWTGGFFFNSVELTNNKADGIELKETVKPGLGFWRTPTIPFWIGTVVIIIGLVALIWWWVASSNKEDKEEESL